MIKYLKLGIKLSLFRSITGSGLLNSQNFKKEIKIFVKKIQSGTRVYD